MAAPNQTPSYGGQVNLAGATDALFLKVFSGEVLAAFVEQNKALPRTMTRTIQSGKSAQFPATWKNTASYHTPGTWILGNQIAGAERVIVIDDIAISPVFIADIDEAKSHFDFRSEYSYQCGAALARQVDKHVLQVGLLAARASATITGGDGGTQVTLAAAKTDADTLITGIFDAVQAMDEKNVPESDRFTFVYPDQYYNLVNSSSKLINRDYGGEGNGSVARGEVLRVAGTEIVKTNNLPRTNIAGDNTPSGSNDYSINASNTAALVMHKSAVGTVSLIGLGVEMKYQLETLGTLIVAKQALGHGILRPESAVEIKVA